MTESLAIALAELQSSLPDVRKSETAHVKSDKGNYSYSYADLAAISRVLMPRLGALGLSFTSRPTLIGDRFVLAYALLHTSGEREAGEYPLPTSGSPQAIGSAITYARRYALCAVTGVAPDTDDDDGARAEVEHHRPPREVEPTQAQEVTAMDLGDEIQGAGIQATIDDIAVRARKAMEAGRITRDQYNSLGRMAGARVQVIGGSRDSTGDSDGSGAESGEPSPGPTEDGGGTGERGPGRDGEAGGVRPGIQSGIHRSERSGGAAQASGGHRGTPAATGGRRE